jgi:hypothetical protein
MNIHVTSAHVNSPGVPKLVDDTLRSFGSTDIKCHAVKPSGQTLRCHAFLKSPVSYLCPRNETFGPFDNFPEEICRASRAFCYDPAYTHARTHTRAHTSYRAGNPFKTTSLSSGSEELVLLLVRHPRDTNHAPTDPSRSRERRIRPSSFTRFQRPTLVGRLHRVVLMFVPDNHRF